MASTIRIKKRASSGSAGAPSSLASSELAFNENTSDKKLYYGYGDNGSGVATSIIAVGGPGAFCDLTTAQTVAGAKTFSDNVVVTGNLTVNGTTTTVNSTTTTVDDPVFTIGGDGNGSDDSKDRGIEFKWHNGSAAKVGFFGFDDSTGKFTFIPDASNSSETFTGSAGTIVAALEGNATTATALATGRTIAMTGDVAWTSQSFDGSGNVTGAGTIQSGAVETGMIAADAVTAAKLADNAVVTANITDANVTTAKIATNAVTTAKITDANITTAKIAADAITGAKIADGVLESEHYANGSVDYDHISFAIDEDNMSSDSATKVPTQQSVKAYVDSNIGGNAATFTTTANNSTDETVYPVFVDGTSSAQGAEVDTGLTYNPSSGLLTTTKVDALIDGGTF